MQAAKWAAAGLLAASLGLTGCASGEDLGEASNDAAQVQPVPGTDVARVTLTPEAIERLGIQTEPVRAAPAKAGPLTVVSFAALLYDPEGATWVYTSDAARASFVRAAVKVDHIAGNLAYLRTGPAAGTPVVILGAAELLGAEHGVGGE